jgi:hypothetical protein
MEETVAARARTVALENCTLMDGVEVEFEFWVWRVSRK